MLRLLQSDFYRLFKSKAFYICNLVAVVLLAGGVFLNDWASRIMAENPQSTSMPLSTIKNGISYGITTFSDGQVHLFISIFVAIFVTAEFVHGTMKNVVSKGFPKYQIYISKIITMVAATFIMMFTIFIFVTIAATIVSGKFGVITGGFLVQILGMIGVELLLHAALTALFVMVAMTIRNGAAVIAINIIGVNSILPMTFQLIDYLFKNKTQFSFYTLQYNIVTYYQNLTPPAESIIRAIIVSVVYFSVATAIGIYAFKNTDVK